MTPTDAVLILVSRGLSEAAIAAAARAAGTKATQSQVNRIKQGYGCRYRLGEALIALARSEQDKAGSPAGEGA